MTHQEFDSTVARRLIEIVGEQGLEGLKDAMELLLNEAMKIERSAFLGAGPYERSEERVGYANGFKPKRMRSRAGELELDVPQVRGLRPGAERFYPSALERGT
jgi:transposase-like protein